MNPCSPPQPRHRRRNFFSRIERGTLETPVSGVEPPHDRVQPEQFGVDHEGQGQVETSLVLLEAGPLLHQLDQVTPVDLDDLVHVHPGHTQSREDLYHELVPWGRYEGRRCAQPPGQLLHALGRDPEALMALVVAGPLAGDKAVALETLEGRVHLPDVERPDVAGARLELLAELEAVLRPLAQEGEKCVPDAHEVDFRPNILSILLSSLSLVKYFWDTDHRRRRRVRAFDDPAAGGGLSTTRWDPDQYNRFASEREKPFWDLVSLLDPAAGARVVDLGCGDGRLTAAVHHRLGARSTLGVDSSPEMLGAAGANAGSGVGFVQGDIATWQGEGLDLVFSNAALHWVPDHPTVLGRLRRSLSPAGQLAVQVPANPDHPSHRIASEVAAELIGADAPPDPVAENVMRPEQYSELLHSLGFVRQHVRLQVYDHVLPSSAAVVEWVKGTSLTRFKAILGPEDFEEFLGEYKRRLLGELGDQRPYFYAFKRILFWGSLG